ncbi:hypothetical protein E1B28_008407 [Marasmius oreades]|uniref:Uncharacterized protein n=1 Tax=Marasmius oreades TaxID=181124 RepID=A0A9P7RYH0_9AGAR|nr:uncharacterized protein E1B28_008407 [Marasmius oreades]KAG7092025.1 hypothetical protein E1B28_008407 [Marasmius oreades]
MPVIWGFDLSEMHWSAFGHANMFDRRWHLRRERFVVYQLAMLICLAAECTATYSLDKYEDLQKHVEAWSGHRAHLFNNDIIDAEITTIVFCVMVATLFGADFFFLLFFPRRRYPAWYTITKKIFAVVITAGVFAAAVLSTVIVARNSATISGVSAEEAKSLTDLYFRPPLQYNKWAVNIAYVCVLWPGFLATAASTVILFIAADWDAVHGTDPRDETLREKGHEVADTGSP